MLYEKDISAIESASGAHARVPRADGDAGRPGSIEPTPRARSQEPDGITSGGSRAAEETTGTAPSFSFPACLRLRLQRDFDHVYRHGQRTRGALMALVALCPSPDGSFKAAVSARKKEYHDAVDRNRVRRRLHELVRLNRHVLPHDLWIAVRAHSGVGTATWDALQREFLALCAHAGFTRTTTAQGGHA